MPESLKCALRSLYEEIAEFRFDYPLITVPEAGPKESLHYYVYKYRDSPPYRSVMRLDSNGVARVWGRVTGVVYRPGFVAMYGLRNLGHYLRTGNQEHLNVFLGQVNWLEQHAVIRGDGAVVWPHDFDLQEGPVLVRAPWVSANVQGFVISALVRGWRITRRPRLLELLKGSARVFELDCENNGVRLRAEGHVVYTEVPGLLAPGIMDGFMRSLLGLFDLHVETGDPKVYELFMQGLEGLRYFLPRWDYRKKWSWYSNRAYLCPPGYHCLNCMLLNVLTRLTGDSYFAEFAEAWNPAGLSLLGRAEIYLVFLLTKNTSRLKHRTWSQHTALDSSQLETWTLP
jgi:D-glucuronyl C5-epimerase C-terminus